MTEIYDYLRLLWARIGTPHCPKCGKEIRQQTIDGKLPEPIHDKKYAAKFRAIADKVV